MSIAFIDQKEMRGLLTDRHWISMNFGEGGFFVYLEETYFKPGTARNGEFETLSGSVMTPEGRKMCFWVRIKDTKQNRDFLHAALCEYYGVPLSRAAFNRRLAKLRREVAALVCELYPEGRVE